VKFRLLLFVVVGLCLSIALSAQELKPEPELVRQMIQDGWTKVAEGVLQRNDGQVETFTYGEDGMRWTTRKLEARLEFLEKEYASNPTEKLAGIIENLKTQLVETDEVMKSGAAGAEVVSPDEISNCTISYWATGAADPKTDSRGVKADATAYFHSNCGHIGNSYAYAYARATDGTVTTTKIQEDPKNNSSWVDSAASASAPGYYDCYSEAHGRTWSPQLYISYEVSDVNYECPPPIQPVSVWIDGPTDVWLDDYTPCQTVTWYAYPSGGTPGYTYKWYLGAGTTVMGTGSSYSRTYCNTNQRADVRVEVTDSSYPARSAQASYSTWFYYQQSCTSGCNCDQNPQYIREPATICPY
jgi:hypothetical protein